MLLNLDKDLGAKDFCTEFAINKIKGSLSQEEYLGWLGSFEYLTNSNRNFTVALRPVDHSIEFHFVTNNSTTKEIIKCFSCLSELLDCPLITYISEKDRKLIDFITKRFGFFISEESGTVNYEGTDYMQYKLQRKAL